MKKTTLLLSSVMITTSSLFFVGCSKEDVSAPVITIDGGNSLYHSLNATFTPPSATATDDEDGDVSAQIVVSNPVNEDLTGDYSVTYTVSDAAGNTATETLVVTVRNDAYALEGKYDGNETDINGPYVYSGNTDASKTVTVTSHTSINNRVWMTRLADFANNTVYLNVTGGTIDLPSQTVANVGTGSATCDVHDRQSQGSGTVTSTGFTLLYNDSKVNGCTGSRTGVDATFTKK